MTCLGDKLPDLWWRNPDLLQAEREAHGTFDGIHLAHGSPSDKTLESWWRKLGLPPVGVGMPASAPVVDDALELDADSLGEIAGLLKARGLNPDEWVVVRAAVRSYEGFLKDAEGDAQIVPMKGLKVTVVPRAKVLLAEPAEVKPIPRRVTKAPARASRLYFIYGDDQHPNADPDFELLKLRWLERNQPDVIVDLGDGTDMPQLSGHKVNPAMNWSVQECLNAYASALHAKRSVCPNAAFYVLADNHFTARLRDYQLARAAALYGVKPAAVDGLEQDLEPLMSPRRMLRLDELGVTYVEPPGDTHYAESHMEIVPGELVAIHGYRTGANLGKKFLDDYGCSVIYGHAHGEDVYVTDQNRRGIGRRERRYAIGVGCGARLHGGGGFAPGADWQNHALTVSVFEDGRWTFSPMSFQHGVLTWQDQRYEVDAAVAAAA